MKKQLKSPRLIIKIKNCQRKIPINKKAQAALARQILKIKGIKKAELSILFAGKQRIRKLNKRFRKQDRPTDVLAFSLLEGRGFKLIPELLGDVVICPQAAQRYAKIYKTNKEKEICLYLIHGILHLLDYDDTSVKSRVLMEQEQARILKKVLS